MFLSYGGLCVNFDIIGEISHGSNRTCSGYLLISTAANLQCTWYITANQQCSILSCTISIS